MRPHKNDLSFPNIEKKLISEVLKLIPRFIFSGLDEQIFDQEFLNDHRHVLIYRIIKNYFNKRLVHESNLLNDMKDRIRSRNNRSTINVNQ